jgi:hypothetical protein
MDFPGHEEAIGILSRAETELKELGYQVEFMKSSSKEECLPAYSNTHFSLKLTARKTEFDSSSFPAEVREDA